MKALIKMNESITPPDLRKGPAGKGSKEAATFHSRIESALSTAIGIEDDLFQWMSRHAVACLQVSLGIIFLAFGGLKLFPGRSPAEGLAGQTLEMMSFGLLSPGVSVPALGLWEALLGLGLLASVSSQKGGSATSRAILRVVLPALFVHLLGTCAPLVLMPGDLFCLKSGHALLSLECQYIIKNLVLVSAAISVGGHIAIKGKTNPPTEVPSIQSSHHS